MIRRTWLLAALMPIPFFLGGATTPAQEAQRELNAVLHSKPREELSGLRTACATGAAAISQRDLREAGFKTAPVGAWCVTVLTRAGRDGALDYLRDPNSTQVSSSFAFDSGFVGGYRKRDALPTSAPSMDALLPVADRCLSQQEPNNRLCSATGYMLGLHAARGEIVALR